MIFRCQPAAGDIILDLKAVYADPDFMETLRATAERLGRTYKGIDQWDGSQKEMVLRETVIGNDKIVSLGAFRELSDVVPPIGQRDPAAPSDAAILKELTGTAVTEHFWTSPTSAQAGIRNVAERMQAHPKHKGLWPEEL
ncbi:hypothetical protein [Hyphomicrobium sp.]|uniref:hypothetical protein n=1 Tax=Hyphomicrobium sp. TaxID=82 RepID=UPI001E12FB66|nr:hypothetical protein [Hyphomicrobium sp.]MBY0562431.1 hypothetical protein [Hyphomicrobium sp.]